MLFTACILASAPLLALAAPPPLISSRGHGHLAQPAHNVRSFNMSKITGALMVGNVPYGSIIMGCTVPGTVALTFDDGPYHWTGHVLDLLDKYHARATFFVNGINYGRSAIDNPQTAGPATLKRMLSAGHQIGSHTWSHVDISNADVATRRFQVDGLAAALDSVIGVRPRYLRPPYGDCNPACLADLKAMGYHVINWNVDTKDYMYNTPQTIEESKKRFDKAVVPGAAATNSYLVLSHDVHQTTANVLAEYMLSEIQKRGYRAATVGECLGDPEENWYALPGSESKTLRPSPPVPAGLPGGRDDDEEDDD